MNSSNIWCKSKQVTIQKSKDITGNFDIGFDNEIPEITKNELKRFVSWVEKNFNIPITLWVDFEYKHYLKDRQGKTVGYLFYWSDFNNYPIFENIYYIPEIRLPVRTEHSTIEEILTSFIEAITCYFAWICNEISENYVPDEKVVEEILQEYLKTR